MAAIVCLCRVFISSSYNGVAVEVWAGAEVDEEKVYSTMRKCYFKSLNPSLVSLCVSQQTNMSSRICDGTYYYCRP